MNAIIGVVGKDIVKDNVIYQGISKNNLKYLNDKISYIGIINYDNNDIIDYNVLDLCDGFIIPGGLDIYRYHLDIIEYCMNNNKPILGICMGHQIIGLYANNEKEEDLVKVDNHNDKNKKHDINIVKNSFLHKILGDKIPVNSRHNYVLDRIDLPFKETATDDNGVIEGIEYIDDKHFLLGVQWHPEDMDNMHNLYNYFIKEVISRKNVRDNSK